MNNSAKKGIFLAVLAAALYAVNSPFSKILLDYMPPTFTFYNISEGHRNAL